MSTIMVSVGIFTKVGNFELDLTSDLFDKVITVVSTMLLYHMYGRRFILFLLRSALIPRGVRIQNIINFLIC